MLLEGCWCPLVLPWPVEPTSSTAWRWKWRCGCGGRLLWRLKIFSLCIIWSRDRARLPFNPIYPSSRVLLSWSSQIWSASWARIGWAASSPLRFIFSPRRPECFWFFCSGRYICYRWLRRAGWFWCWNWYLSSWKPLPRPSFAWIISFLHVGPVWESFAEVVAGLESPQQAGFFTDSADSIFEIGDSLFWKISSFLHSSINHF